MMDRRSFLMAGMAGAVTIRGPWLSSVSPELPQSGYAQTRTGERIYYEVVGPVDGPAVFLAVPIYATTRLWTDTYLSYLTDRYRVLVADYPHQGRSDEINDPQQFTAARVASDYVAIATAAWGERRRFAIAGYSWGGNSSLVTATMTRRLSAVVVGGWPALGGPWAGLLKMSQDLGQATYTAYYGSLQPWSELGHESRLVRAITVPRLNYVDAADDGDTAGITGPTSASMIGPFREHRATLDAWGWDTVEVDGGVAGEYGHNGGMRPDIAGPVIRAFLDTHL